MVKITQLSGDLRSEMAERRSKVCAWTREIFDEDMSVFTGIRRRKLVGYVSFESDGYWRS
jgi:hypothetical protein